MSNGNVGNGAAAEPDAGALRARLGALFWLGALPWGTALAFFWPVLFQDRQFGYRDAAHFYYPLYEYAQREWEAGRVPLWDAAENSGMPLLGNPTTAALYPGKLVYFAMSYPDATRWYAVGHALLAYYGMFLLCRTIGSTRAGAAIGALGYAFGAPVIFQHCNIVFLVGAAWAPWGFAALDLWLRSGRTAGLAPLSLALAMATLGGDPQIAYLTMLAGAGYAVGLSATETGNANGGRKRWKLALATLAIGAWAAATLWIASRVAAWRPTPRNPSMAEPWFPEQVWLYRGLWVLIGIWLARRWWKGRLPEGLARRTGGLLLAGATAGLLCGAQLVPTIEFSRLTARAAATGPHDIYPFSLEPYRLAELAWPNPFGQSYRNEHRALLESLPPISKKIWNPSHYLGAATLILALAAWRWSWRPGPTGDGARLAWLSWVALIGALAAFGSYTGPPAIARLTEAGRAAIGDPDPDLCPPVRRDGRMRDGDGGVYWALAKGLPGFQSFRYPAKLFTLTCLGLCALAAAGWDRASSNAGPARRRAVGLSAALVAASCAGWLAIAAAPERTGAAIEACIPEEGAFSFSREGALSDLKRAFGHGALAAAAIGGALLIARPGRGRRFARAAGPLAALALAVDLSIANAGLILTIPQSIFETEPKYARLIREAEEAEPAGGPFRVHRVPFWHPPGLADPGSDRERLRRMTEWEIDTLQPKYGITRGIEYTSTLGTMELYDYSFFVNGFYREIGKTEGGGIDLEHLRRRGFDRMAGPLGLEPGRMVVYMPRRGFDLWNTRYFILPANPSWEDEHRGILSFLEGVEPIHPRAGAFATNEETIAWLRDEDAQIFRNPAAGPRAWIAREPRIIPYPIRGLDRDSRQEVMYELLFQNDLVWTSRSRRVFDPRTTVWIENEDEEAYRAEMERASASSAPGKTGDDPGEAPSGSDADSVIVRYPHPARAELEIHARRPGTLVLADVFYPGWEATLNGEPARVFRVNRMMRGVVVPAGRHEIVFEYRPASFRIGLALTAVGVPSLLALGVAGWREDRRRKRGAGE